MLINYIFQPETVVEKSKEIMEATLSGTSPLITKNLRKKFGAKSDNQ